MPDTDPVDPVDPVAVTAGPAPLRIAVLGSSSIARRRMLPAFTAHPHTEIAAIASRDPARARELTDLFGGTPLAGYAEALRPDNGVDAVYVPLPIALHAEWVERALDAGKHVLAEKPLTDDPAVAAKLFRLAASRGLALMENVFFLHHGQHAEVERLLADGAIGELRAFSAAFAIPPPPEADLRYRPELGGGALLDIGYYPLRAALRLLGPGLEVVGAAARTAPGRSVETSGSALLYRAADGVQVQLAYGMEHFYRSCYELWGSEGRLRVEPAYTPDSSHAPRLRLESRAGRSEIFLSAEDQVANTVGAFVRAVRAGGADVAAADAAVRQIRLLHEIRARAAAPAGPAAVSAGRPAARRSPW